MKESLEVLSTENGIVGYPLTTNSFDFAIRQLPPQGVVESQRRKKMGTTKKAIKFIEYANRVIEHKLTCNEEACQQFRELLKLEVIKDES